MTGFTPAIRDAIRQGAIDSAAVIVPTVVDLINPRRVLDIGCGEGIWTRAFAAHDILAIGVDLDVETYESERLRFYPADLEQPIEAQLPFVDATFDMVACLEVAEHLTPERGATFVAELCAFAPIVLFSAAAPWQGGVNHINEQWPGYWADEFARHGFTTSGFLRWPIWTDDRVEPWYRQNLLIAVHEDECARMPDGWLYDVPPWSVVHPTIWTWYRRPPEGDA